MSDARKSIRDIKTVIGIISSGKVISKVVYNDEPDTGHTELFPNSFLKWRWLPDSPEFVIPYASHNFTEQEMFDIEDHVFNILKGHGYKGCFFRSKEIEQDKQ